MAVSDTNSNSPSPSPSSPSLSPPPNVIASPCAACKILRRRCTDKCVLAPYFPPSEPLKFTTAHRVFGASNIIKFLQELPEHQRSDAVISMVYEANARIRDPVYGSAGTIFQLQKQVRDLQTQLAKAQAERLNMEKQQENLLALICMAQSQQLDPEPFEPTNGNPIIFHNNAGFLDDNNGGSLWEPLWT